MKKMYKIPSMKVIKLQNQQRLLTGSNGVNSTYGMDYGGIDENGEYGPE